MYILQLLRTKARSFYVLLILLGMGNSLIYSGILYFINHAVTGSPVQFFPGHDWMVYLGIIGISAVCNIVSQKQLIVVANETLVNYETTILRKVQNANSEMFEKMGKQRIFSALGDGWTLADFPRNFVASANTLIIVLCSIGYMYVINVWVASVFTVFLVILSIAYIRSGIVIKREFAAIQTLQDRFYGYMTDYLDGYKEVKMRSIRSENILSKFIHGNREEKKALSIQTYTKDTMFGFLSRFTWYLLIGAIVFLFPVILKMSLKDVTICLLIVLHMLESMNFFLGSIPFYFRVETALKKMNELDKEVDRFSDIKVQAPEAFEEDAFRRVRFEGVWYQYNDESRDYTFRLEPVDLDIRKGETIFIEGGNGSGKSTFINILAGLYKPNGGRIFYNDCLVTPEKYESYINKFSAIYTSHYIFSENYDDFDISDANPFLTSLVHMVELKDVLRINREKKWFFSQLSKGQQKRLALIYALMEDRELLILDEWAAEQDPLFKAYFYEVMLDRLKAMGKTLILVTHDDRYLHHADRILRFEDGRIILDKMLVREHPKEAKSYSL
jgi:ABC-type siderophore export system fused ATPase/permease subunit